jgi:hypothetical protein
MLDLKIREQIVRFVEGGLEPTELEDWLEDESWDLEGGPVRDLAADVLRLLAEYDNGDWTETDLRGQLGAMSRMYWFDQAPKQTRAESASGVIRQDQRSEAAGRRLVAESV